MKMRYVHTNIIARDWQRLSLFYQHVFNCRPLLPQRDLKGEWLDKLTGLKNAHIRGEHLVMPGYEDDLPTLEIFSYDEMNENCSKSLNGIGLAHLAFEVADVAAVLEKIKAEGGGQVGELIETEYPNNVRATFVYATDIEGNIIELQSWQKLQRVYKDSITVNDYLYLRKSVGWLELCKEQAQEGLDNSAYVISCYDNEKIAGMARIVWDRGYIAYLSDVIVYPDYQGQGIGRHMVESAVDFVKSQLKEGWKIKITLASAKGKETFYQKLGFKERPNNQSGPGMELWVS